MYIHTWHSDYKSLGSVTVQYDETRPRCIKSIALNYAALIGQYGNLMRCFKLLSSVLPPKRKHTVCSSSAFEFVYIFQI